MIWIFYSGHISSGTLLFLPGISTTKSGMLSPPIRVRRRLESATAFRPATRKCRVPRTRSHWNT